MGMISTDLLVKSAIEAGINDLRKNNWILPDILGWLAEDQMTASEYGWKEINAFQEFFKTNKLPVYLDFRVDQPEMPSITVHSMPRSELLNRAALGDEGMEEDVEPSGGVARPIKVYQDFTPKAYDRSTGAVTFPDGTTTEFVTPGQFLVASKTGKAYQIMSVADDSSFRIAPNISEDFRNAYVVPQVSAWNLKRELTFVSEQVTVGVHASGNPVHCQWLHDIVWYILLRCKEVYLEARGFELSNISSEPMYLNPNFNVSDRILSRNISLQGQLEVSFIKYQAPKLQTVSGGIRIIDGPRSPDAYQEEVQKQAWKMEEDP
jgi:hypothetical protein